MRTWYWRSGIFLFGLIAAVACAAAQTPQAERRIVGKPGEEIRIGVFATVQKDCKPGTLPSVKLKLAPTNGSVSVKQGRVRATNLKECLAIEVPAFVAVYKSKPDFTGEDEVILEVTEANGRTRTHVIRVIIDSNPAERPAPNRPPSSQGI